MALACFLKLGDIDGESQTTGYLKWIEIESWSWGVSRVEPGGGPLSVQSFGFVANVGPHSARLLGLIVDNEVTKTASLAVVSLAGTGKPKVELQCSFTNVTLSSYDVGEPEGTGPLLEQVSFVFGSLKMTTGKWYTAVSTSPLG